VPERPRIVTSRKFVAPDFPQNNPLQLQK
jgi:hypothetical protein